MDNQVREVNLDDLSIVELKAVAYDLSAQREGIVSKMKMINQKIVEKSKAAAEPKAEVVDEEKPVE